MDLAFRVCVEFLLHEFGARSSGCVDCSTSTLIAVDPKLRLSARRLRTLNRISDISTTSAERRSAIEKALQNRDVLKMKQHARTLVHYVCTTIRVVSQEADAPRSTHYVFQSRVFLGVSSTPLCAFGPRAILPSCPEAGDSASTSNSSSGWMCMLINVHSSMAEWLQHVFLFLPLLRRDPSLCDTQHTLGAESNSILYGGAAGAGQQTPRKPFDDTASTTEQTPTLSQKGEDVAQCDVCLRTVPLSVCIFLEWCSHCMCLSCMSVCAEKHTLAPYATPCNMPCPAFGCPATLLRSEVALLVSGERFAQLEANEVRYALHEDYVACPKCLFVFESYHGNDVLPTDPLRLKIQCAACETEFCKRCNTSPFHEGKACRDGGAGQFTPKCRYCGNSAVALEPPVCDARECETKGSMACTVTKPCGHMCHGTNGEAVCVPCLEDSCASTQSALTHSADDYCVICYTEALRDAPCLQLDCGHVFHFHCLQTKLEKRWPTARIGFTFFGCPLCGVDITHHLLSKWVDPIRRIRDHLESRYVERLRMEGLHECHALVDPSSAYYNKPVDYGRDNLNYYMCSKCSKPYYGGLRACQDVNREEPNRADLICGGCSAGSAVCDKHGNQYMEWKCKYCCNTAVWYCWGTTHFCELCHSPPRKSVREECPGEEHCPLRGKHQPNGVEFAIGCAMCRAATTSSSGSIDATK